VCDHHVCCDVINEEEEGHRTATNERNKKVAVRKESVSFN
jgi:hypothetical protein